MGHFENGRWVKDEPVRHMEITIDTQTALDIMLLKLALAEMNSSEIPNSSNEVKYMAYCSAWCGPECSNCQYPDEPCKYPNSSDDEPLSNP